MEYLDNSEPYLNLSSLIEVSPLLGFPFGRNDEIRSKQNISLALDIQKNTSVKILDNLRKNFYFGTLDFISYKTQNKRKFKLLEFSGTGSGGTSAISLFAFNTILHQLTGISDYIYESKPLILLAYTDSQSLNSSLPRKFIYERFFFAQAIKTSLQNKYRSASIATLPEIVNSNQLNYHSPLIIIGFMKDFMKHIKYEKDGLKFKGHKITAILNDSLCNAIFNHYDIIDSHNNVYLLNEIFRLSGNKGQVYKLNNELIKNNSDFILSSKTDFTYCYDQNELIQKTYELCKSGKQIVIKPLGGAVGMGIDFFLSQLTKKEISIRVQKSIKEIKGFLGPHSKIFPYTISEYIDYDKIDNIHHPLNGYKYELRIVVYIDGNVIKAFPSLVRVAGEVYNPNNFSKHMLFSYASLADSKITVPKQNFMLPLSNFDTLNLIDLSPEELEKLCLYSTHFIQYAIQNLKTINSEHRVLTND
jgi:hypothetical protein